MPASNGILKLLFYVGRGKKKPKNELDELEAKRIFQRQVTSSETRYFFFFRGLKLAAW